MLRDRKQIFSLIFEFVSHKGVYFMAAQKTTITVDGDTE